MEERQTEQIKLINSLPVFNQLDPNDVAEMLEQKQVIRIITYEPEDKLITEKQLDQKIFLMLRGKVKISKHVLREDCKQDKHIKTLEGNGHFFGEISTITGKPRTASVTAVTKTACLVIDFSLLLNTSSQLLERVKNKLYPKLFDLLGKRLEETDECFVALKQHVEDLEKKIMELMQEKFQFKKELQDELIKKNKEINQLKATLEVLGAV
jgi:CRP-like cAMP-binding protein